MQVTAKGIDYIERTKTIIMKMELITTNQQAKHLKKHLPKSWKRFINQRIIEHDDNKVSEPFKCYNKEYWKDVYNLIERKLKSN